MVGESDQLMDFEWEKMSADLMENESAEKSETKMELDLEQKKALSLEKQWLE